MGTIRFNKTGRYVALGDKEGSTTILKVNDSLFTCVNEEKSRVQQLFEREGLREKTLNQSLKSKQAAAKLIEAKKRAKQRDDEEKAEKEKSIHQSFIDSLVDIE